MYWRAPNGVVVTFHIASTHFLFSHPMPPLLTLSNSAGKIAFVFQVSSSTIHHIHQIYTYAAKMEQLHVCVCLFMQASVCVCICLVYVCIYVFISVLRIGVGTGGGGGKGALGTEAPRPKFFLLQENHLLYPFFSHVSLLQEQVISKVMNFLQNF